MKKTSLVWHPLEVRWWRYDPMNKNTVCCDHCWTSSCFWQTEILPAIVGTTLRHLHAFGKKRSRRWNWKMWFSWKLYIIERWRKLMVSGQLHIRWLTYCWSKLTCRNYRYSGRSGQISLKLGFLLLVLELEED